MTAVGPAKTCILAIDQGTTSSRAILFDRRGVPQATAQQEFPQLTRTQHTRTQPAGATTEDVAIVEHDPEDIWRSQLSCARRVLEASGTSPEQVAAIERMGREWLAPLAALAHVREVRCRGGFLAVETEKAFDRKALAPLILEHSVWLRPIGNVLYAVPPFTITPAELRQVVAAMTAAVAG